MTAERCVPCEDGRKLLLAAFAARAAWALATHRFWSYAAGGPAVAPAATVARAALLGVSALTSVLVYRLALNLRLSRAAALCAGALAAADPALIESAARAPAESAFLALACAFLLAWLYAWQSGRVRDAALAGFFAGAATFFHAALLPFAAVLVLAAAWSRREQPRWRALAAAGALCWIVVFFLWHAAEGGTRLESISVIYGHISPAAVAAARVFAFVSCVFAIFGARSARKAPGVRFLLGWAAFVVSCGAAVATGFDWRVPFAPVLAVFAGAGLASLLRLD